MTMSTNERDKVLSVRSFPFLSASQQCFNVDAVTVYFHLSIW